jgi:hypothetical protein
MNRDVFQSDGTKIQYIIIVLQFFGTSEVDEAQAMTLT